MKVIAIINPKGGVGKTNTTRTIARGLNLAGKNVLIGETDPQNSLIEWYLANEGRDDIPEVRPLNTASSATIENTMKDAAEKFKADHKKTLEYFVIDGCALEFRIINSVLNVADLVIIPTQPSPDDLCQLGEVIELVEEKQLKRKAKNMPELKARTLINKAKQGTALLKEAQNLLGNINNVPFPCFKTVIRDYEAIRRAATHGGTAFESRNKNAKDDAKSLINEIFKVLR